ncbi:MAG: hypothetical protein FD166_2588 [Bacteroidetes bacterium]|nr:MAG: hypothetical protein FD166_2588 [Bacteroidota bacterium]
MKNSSLFLLLSLVFSFVVSSSAAQQTVFNKVYYDDMSGFHTLGSDIMPDHGYVMVGKKYDNSGHIMKIDSSGNVEWTRQLSKPDHYSEINDVISNPDSTIVTAGLVNTSSEPLLNIVKWSKAGDTLWTRNLDGLASFSSISIRRSSAGGYFITASNQNFYTLSNNTSQILKLDINGELVWSKTYLSDDYLIFLNAIDELPDFSLILAGYVKNKESNEFHLFISHTDEAGIPLWSEMLENPEGFTYSEAFDVSVTPEGFVVLAKVADRTSLIKTEFTGTPLWSRTYSWSGWSMWTDTSGKITRLPDGSFIIASVGYMGEITKTDTSGFPEWVQSVFMEIVDVVPSSDGGYTAFGNGPILGVKTVPNYIPQIAAYKTDSEGNGGSCVYSLIQEMQNYTATFNSFNIEAFDLGAVLSSIITINSFPVLVEDTCVAYVGGVNNQEPDNNSLRIFPNPATDVFSIEIPVNNPNNYGRLEIISEEGRLVYTCNDFTSLSNGINPGYFPEGIYLVRLISGNNDYTGKLMIRH